MSLPVVRSSSRQAVSLLGVLVVACVVGAQTTAPAKPAGKAAATTPSGVKTTAAREPVGMAGKDAEARRFVDALLARMTLEEKVGQMTQVSPQMTDTVGSAGSPGGMSNEDRVRHGEVGSYLFVTDAKEINRLQHIAVDETRLKIPLIFGFDVIHGFHTIFPVPLAMAASWNPAAAETAQGFAAREASSVGINWTFAPMVDIARDPRWGRIVEGAGEDPYLGSAMAAAQVRGFQGPAIGTPNHIVACVKHFAGYGAADGGRDYDASNISDEQLWNVYLPPFHAAEQAGVGTFMTAYMDLNGVPATGNRFLLHDVLREDWGFKGFVVSDWEAVGNLVAHGFAADAEDAAARAANAGTDMEMTSTTYRHALPEAVKAGKVSLSTVDEAVRDILMVKYKLGLFTHPYVDAGAALTPADLAAEREGSRKAAEQTAVLLRNEGGLLPLSKATKSIAVVGPLADSEVDVVGAWSLAVPLVKSVSVLEGLRAKLGAKVTLHYAKGVEIVRDPPSMFAQFTPEPPATLHTDAEKAAAFHEAVQAAEQSDVTVMVLGEQKDMSGERASRADLTLPGEQERLLEAVVATGKPVVLVLLNGRPLNISWASTHVASILEAWYPGSEAGTAIANLLTGDANPGGKLPLTWPRSVGQIPIYYAHNLTMDPQDDATRYWDEPSTPLYPFGYGLSYAKFTLGALSLDKATITPTGMLKASVDVTNTSDVPGDEVVQLYIHQRAGGTSRPVRQLKGFSRVTLAPGEKKTVTLTLRAADLSYWNPQRQHPVIDPGTFDVWMGEDSRASDHATFVVKP